MKDQYNYSVIIPYRDKYDLLLKAVKSIPDRNDIQILIIDNSNIILSKDKVPHKQNASVLFLTSDPTMGAGRARNEGLKHSRGEWLIFLDSDDYFTKDAFDVFDVYKEQDYYDIVYFQTDSVRLNDGQQSSRHKRINKLVTTYLNNGNDGLLRYNFVNPIAKMVRTTLVINNNIQFDEIPVCNDAMFSVKSGHYAKNVTGCSNVVYIITEGAPSTSLTKLRSAQNQFTRFKVAISKYKFLESVGHRDFRPKLLSFIVHAIWEFGPKEGLKWILFAHKQGVRIFF